MGKNMHFDKTWEIYLPKENKKVKVDLKDLKIAHLLINNCRISLASLKKIVRLSKPSLINRIQKLNELGILNGYTCCVDFLRLGAKVYNIEIKTGFSITERDNFVENLKKNTSITQIISVSNRDFDLIIRAVLLKDEIDEIIDYLTKYNISDLNIYSIRKIYYTGVDFFNLQIKYSPTKKDFSFSSDFNTSQTNIGTIKPEDIKLLYILTENSRINIEDLSLKIGLSRETIKKKISNLIKAGVIIDFFSPFDLYKLGLSPYLFKIKVFKRQKQKEIIDFFLNSGRCHGVFEHEESWNLFTFLSFKDRHELSLFENTFLSKFKEYIKEYEIILVQEQQYYNLFPQKLNDELLKLHRHKP